MKCLVNGQITTDTIATCQGYVLLEPVDVIAVQSFDQELYLEVSGYLLLSFVIGHGAGRVVRWMGKA
ncbi:hypothetical protein JCM19240_5855 [Vibrio maritimus]|jgi:hypothetical protein|uniref:Uncharacterized protein n=1 Tax=Vibrio maritimus TaxID=990268 RepID=A0A090T136_9VIBR|nr:hypothetical protein JCM19240_5855 [Vibrio maritimus]